MNGATWSWEQLWTLWLLASLLVVTVAALVRLRGALRDIPRAIILGVAVATVVAVLLPILAVRPAFVHISMHGPLLLESVLAFPSPAVHRPEFGQGGYVVLGLVAAAFGRSAEVVMAANACFSAATTPLIGFLAARWAGRAPAALYASAAWATSPLIARLAHSEDVHVVAVFFATMALAWAELASTRRSLLALAGAVLATQLAIWTRQTTYLSALLVVAVLLERRRAAPRAPGRMMAHIPFLVAIAAILVSLAARVLSTLGESGDAMLLPVLGMLARHPDLALADLLRHPFLTPVQLSVLVPTLGFLGMAYLARRGPVRVSFVVYMAAMLFMTLPASFRSVGVSWSFRLPLYALGLVAVGVGGAVLEHALEARRRRPFSDAERLGGAALCAAVGLVAKGTLENRAPNAEFIEYTFIRDTLLAEPRPFALASVHLEEPSSELPNRIARRMGLPIVADADLRNDGPTRWIFFEGLACHGHSLPTLFEQTLSGPPTDADRERLILAMFDPRRGFGIRLVSRPSGMRAPCKEMAGRAVPPARDGPSVRVDDDPPMVVFDGPEVRLRVLRGTGAAYGS